LRPSRRPKRLGVRGRDSLITLSIAVVATIIHPASA
jgi:hypothetical protein